MLSGSTPPTLSELTALVPQITSVYDLRTLLTLVSLGGRALGSSPAVSALVKTAFRHVVATKLVFDDDACVFFKMALDHCAATSLLPRSDCMLLDRQAEKVNTESADWVVDLQQQVYANTARLDVHDTCLRAVVTGLHDVHAMVQQNRHMIHEVATRVGTLQQQVAVGRRMVAQLIEHANGQSDEMARLAQRLSESERKVASVTTRFESFHTAFAQQQAQEEKNERAKKMCGIVTSVVGLFVPAVKEIADAIIDYANPVEIVKLVYGESDVAAFVADATPHALPPAVERQLAKLAIPKDEFEALLREEIASQHPEILVECQQRQLTAAVDGGRSDAARALAPSLDAEEAALADVLGQLRQATDAWTTQQSSSAPRATRPSRPLIVTASALAATAATDTDTTNERVVWQPPTATTPATTGVDATPAFETPSTAVLSGKTDAGRDVAFADDVAAFPFHAAVHASGGDLAAFTQRIGGSDINTSTTMEATTPMAMTLRYDAQDPSTTPIREALGAAEYAYARGYRDVGDFLAAQLDDPASAASILSSSVQSVRLLEPVDDFPYVAVVDQCQGDVDECELLVELLHDEGHDPHTRIHAEVVRTGAVTMTTVEWSAVEYASFLGYVEIVKLLVKEHCPSLPTRTKVQLLKDARERAVRVAEAAP